MKQFIGINPLVIYGLLLGLLIFMRKGRARTIFFWMSIVSWLLTAAVLRFQFIPACVYGLTVFLFINFAWTALEINSKLFRRMILTGLLVIELISFPVSAYSISRRRPEMFQQAVDYAINKRLVSRSGFNVIQISSANPGATVGFESRYFFLKNGYQPDSEFAYSQSKRSIIFSDDPDVNLIRFHSWETRQFGDQYFSRAKNNRLAVWIFILSINNRED